MVFFGRRTSWCPLRLLPSGVRANAAAARASRHSAWRRAARDPLLDSRGLQCDILVLLAVGFVPRIVVLGGVLDVYKFGPVVGVAEEAVWFVGLVVKGMKGDVDIISCDT